MKTTTEILYVSAFVVILLVCGGRGEDRSIRFDEELLEKLRRETPDPIMNLGLHDASGRLKPGVNPRRQLSRWEYRRTRIKYLDLVNEIQADHGLRKTPNADNWDGLIGDIAATEELMDEITSAYRAQKRNGNGGRPDSVATSSKRRTSGRASSHRRTSESTSSRRPASESTSSTRRGSSSTRESRRRRTKRTTITSDSNKYWPFNTPIQYIINGADASAVRAGIQHWEDNTCIRFNEMSTSSAPFYLQFIQGGGCSSYVGKVIPGGQDISIGIGCEGLGTVVHEIGHALGFYHEQAKPTRDLSVTILFGNIIAGTEHNFVAAAPADVLEPGLPYDYRSVMHYGQYAFSSNGQITINAHIDRDLLLQRIGQRDGLSFHDIKLANIVYCDGVCAGIMNNCERGIQNPNDCTRCICPDDFTWQFCENVLPPTGTSKFGEIRELACGDSGTITDTVSPDGTTFKTSVLLKSPANSVITLRLTSIDTIGYTDAQVGCPDHLEVRTNTEIIGRRYCSDHTGGFTAETSSANEVLIIISGNHGFSVSFSIDYSVNSPCVDPTPPTQPPTPSTEPPTTTTEPPTRSTEPPITLPTDPPTIPPTDPPTTTIPPTDPPTTTIPPTDPPIPPTDPPAAECICTATRETECDGRCGCLTKIIICTEFTAACGGVAPAATTETCLTGGPIRTCCGCCCGGWVQVRIDTKKQCVPPPQKPYNQLVRRPTCYVVSRSTQKRN